MNSIVSSAGKVAKAERLKKSVQKRGIFKAQPIDVELWIREKNKKSNNIVLVLEDEQQARVHQRPPSPMLD